MRHTGWGRRFERTGIDESDRITDGIPRLDVKSDAVWQIAGRAAAITATHDLTVTAVGVTITGTQASELIDATHTVPGQPFPTNDDDTIRAAGGFDIISSLGGNDFLDGGEVGDWMIGGPGDDTYAVYDSTDTVTEFANEGTDVVLVQASLSLDSYTLGPHLEHLLFTGGYSIDGTGNAAANFIQGNSGINILSGLGGADVLDGGTGPDWANYAASPAGLSVNLLGAPCAGGHAQGDTLLNIENLTGSSFADILVGDSLPNRIDGGAGSDLLFGGDGDDGLAGSADGDWLFGSTGADEFVYGSLTDFAAASPIEVIFDFSSAESDTIDLILIDANSNAMGNQAFTFLGAGGFTNHAGELNYIPIPGGLLVQGDVTGDGAADFFFAVLGAAALSATDFVL